MLGHNAVSTFGGLLCVNVNVSVQPRRVWRVAGNSASAAKADPVGMNTKVSKCNFNKRHGAIMTVGDNMFAANARGGRRGFRYRREHNDTIVHGVMTASDRHVAKTTNQVPHCLGEVWQ